MLLNVIQVVCYFPSLYQTFSNIATTTAELKHFRVILKSSICATVDTDPEANHELL